MCLLHYIAGAFTQPPEQLKDRIGAKAGDLIKRSFDDIDPARLVDYHTQLAGIGTGATGVRQSKNAHLSADGNRVSIQRV